MKENWRFCAKLTLVGLMTLGLFCSQQLIDWLLDRPTVDERLICAATAGDQAELESALHAGASPRARDIEGRTALCYAAQFGDVRMVRRLLRAGADVNAADDRGITPLIWAVNSRSLAMVMLLCQHGSDPLTCDKFGVTALQVAEQDACDDIVEFLRSVERRASLASAPNR